MPNFGTKGTDVSIGKCPILVQKYLCYFWDRIYWYCYLKLLICVQKLLMSYLVQKLLVLFETAILGTKITSVIFGTEFTGIAI